MAFEKNPRLEIEDQWQKPTSHPERSEAVGDFWGSVSMLAGDDYADKMPLGADYGFDVPLGSDTSLAGLMRLQITPYDYNGAVRHAGNIFFDELVKSDNPKLPNAHVWRRNNFAVGSPGSALLSVVAAHKLRRPGANKFLKPEAQSVQEQEYLAQFENYSRMRIADGDKVVFYALISHVLANKMANRENSA